MDVILIILSALCLLVGLVGTVVPVLPGVPISYVGLLLLHFTDRVDFSWQTLLFWGVLVAVVQLIDFMLPSYFTKQAGASRRAVIGSVLGLIVGLFLGPIGVIFGPFVGAFLGELSAGKGAIQALKSGGASLVGFILCTVLKIVISGMMIVKFFTAIF